MRRGLYIYRFFFSFLVVFLKDVSLSRTEGYHHQRSCPQRKEKKKVKMSSYERGRVSWAGHTYSGGGGGGRGGGSLGLSGSHCTSGRGGTAETPGEEDMFSRAEHRLESRILRDI